MILHDKEIKKLQGNNPALIENFIHWDTQIQPNGFDLTVGEVHKFKAAGQLDFSNKERKLPETEKIEFKDMWATLDPGVYKIKTNETINLPNDVIAFCQTRTSLLRMGVLSATGFWDAGYKGRGEFIIQVVNPHGMKIKQNSRVVQIAFVKLPEKPTETYSGAYQGMK